MAVVVAAGLALVSMRQTKRAKAGEAVAKNSLGVSGNTCALMAGLPEEARESLGKQVPFPSRLGRPEEVADLVAFLCSDRAGYISGQTVSINGGMA